MPTQVADTMTVTREDYVLGVIVSSGFRVADDGWFYPQGAGDPIVRVSVNDALYCMERRRTPESAWMRIVTANVNEFDQQAFEHWVENWPLTA